MFLKVCVFAQPGGLWWEVALGGIGRYSSSESGHSFYNVNACFFDGNGNNPKVVFSSSLSGEVSTLGCYDLMALLFLEPIYAEYVMWI